MFLGLKLLVLLVVSPLIIGLFLYGLKKKSEFIGKTILSFYGVVAVSIILMSTIGILRQKIVLDKSDFYGEYVIDRSYFAGKQANWQYNNFRFEILKNDSIYFYVTDGKKIIETYKGKISTVAPYKSARLAIKMENPSHHILSTNPTIYRASWDFFMVFKSPKFNNVYFRKGEWEIVE